MPSKTTVAVAAPVVAEKPKRAPLTEERKAEMKAKAAAARELKKQRIAANPELAKLIKAVSEAKADVKTANATLKAIKKALEEAIAETDAHLKDGAPTAVAGAGESTPATTPKKPRAPRKTPGAPKKATSEEE
jgi:seryl-tRNA synthetase